MAEESIYQLDIRCGYSLVWPLGTRGGGGRAYINMIFVVVVVWLGRWVTGKGGEVYIKLIFVVVAAFLGRWGHWKGGGMI